MSLNRHLPHGQEDSTKNAKLIYINLMMRECEKLLLSAELFHKAAVRNKGAGLDSAELEVEKLQAALQAFHQMKVNWRKLCRESETDSPDTDAINQFIQDHLMPLGIKINSAIDIENDDKEKTKKAAFEQGLQIINDLKVDNIVSVITPSEKLSRNLIEDIKIMQALLAKQQDMSDTLMTHDSRKRRDNLNRALANLNERLDRHELLKTQDYSAYERDLIHCQKIMQEIKEQFMEKAVSDMQLIQRMLTNPGMFTNPESEDHDLNLLSQSYFDRDDGYKINKFIRSNLHRDIHPDNQNNNNYSVLYNQLLELAQNTRSQLISRKKIRVSEGQPSKPVESINDHISELEWIEKNADKFSSQVIREIFEKYHDPKSGNMRVLFESLSGSEVMHRKAEMSSRFHEAKSKLISLGILGDVRQTKKISETQARKQTEELKKLISRFEHDVEKTYKKSVYTRKQAEALKQQYQQICRLTHEMEGSGAFKHASAAKDETRKTDKIAKVSLHEQARTTMQRFDRVNFKNKVQFFATHPLARQIHEAEQKMKELSDWLYSYLHANPEQISGQQARMARNEISRLNRDISALLIEGQAQAKKHQKREFNQFLQEYIDKTSQRTKRVEEQVNNYYSEKLTGMIDDLSRRIDIYLKNAFRDEQYVGTLKQYKEKLQEIKSQHAGSQFRNFKEVSLLHDMQRDFNNIESRTKQQREVSKKATSLVSQLDEKLRELGSRMQAEVSGTQVNQMERLAALREQKQAVNARIRTHISQVDTTPITEPLNGLTAKINKISNMLKVANKSIPWDQMESDERSSVRQAMVEKVRAIRDNFNKLTSEYIDAFRYGHDSAADIQALLSQFELLRKKTPMVKTPEQMSSFLDQLADIMKKELSVIKAKKINARIKLENRIGLEIEKSTQAKPVVSELPIYDPVIAIQAALLRQHERAVRIQTMQHGLTDSIILKNNIDLQGIESSLPQLESNANTISTLLSILKRHAEHDSSFKTLYEAISELAAKPLEDPVVAQNISDFILQYQHKLQETLEPLKQMASESSDAQSVYWDEFRFISGLIQDLDVTHPVRYNIDDALENYESDHAERIRFERERKALLERLAKINGIDIKALLAPLNKWEQFQSTRHSDNKTQVMEHVITDYKDELSRHQAFIKQQNKLFDQSVQIASQLILELDTREYLPGSLEFLDRVSPLVKQMEARIEYIHTVQETLALQIDMARKDSAGIKQLQSQLSRILNHPDFQQMDQAADQIRMQSKLIQEFKQAKHALDNCPQNFEHAPVREQLRSNLNVLLKLCSGLQGNEEITESIKTIERHLKQADSIADFIQKLKTKTFFENINDKQNTKLLREFLESIPEECWHRNKNVDAAMKACHGQNADINNLLAYINLDDYLEITHKKIRDELSDFSIPTDKLKNFIDKLELSLEREKHKLSENPALDDYMTAKQLLAQVNRLSIVTNRQLEVAALCPPPEHIKSMTETHLDVLDVLPEMQQQTMQLSEKYKQQKTQKLDVKPEIAEKAKELGRLGMFVHHQPQKQRSTPDTPINPDRPHHK